MRLPYKQHRAPDSHRKIGKKVMLADRLHHVVKPVNKQRSSLQFISSYFAKIPKTAIVAAVVVIALAIVGTQLVAAKITSDQKVAEAKEQAALKKQRIAASKCREQKAAQRTDLLGKVTYDELYDYDECDKKN